MAQLFWPSSACSPISYWHFDPILEPSLIGRRLRTRFMRSCYLISLRSLSAVAAGRMSTVLLKSLQLLAMQSHSVRIAVILSSVRVPWLLATRIPNYIANHVMRCSQHPIEITVQVVQKISKGRRWRGSHNGRATEGVYFYATQPRNGSGVSLGSWARTQAYVILVATTNVTSRQLLLAIDLDLSAEVRRRSEATGNFCLEIFYRTLVCFLWLTVYTVSQKTCDNILYNNCKNRSPITIIFGPLSSQSMRHRMVVSSPTSSV